MGNFDYFSRTNENPWFNHFSSAYNNERKLYNLLVTEAYNLHGICCHMYPVSVDTDYDRIFGEDNNRLVVSSFPIMAYFNLPRETKKFSTQGQLWVDKFHIYIAKRHFAAACASYSPGYLPKIGDLIRSDYNDVYYEILSVKAEEEQFLQEKHTWDLTVRVYVDRGLSVNPATSADMGSLPDYVSQDDLFNIGKWINDNKESVEYKPGDVECPVNDPFNDFTKN